jgi:hypothetical protein
MWDYEAAAFIPSKDKEIERHVRAIQKEYKTTFEPDDLYFICFFFFNHLKTIGKRKEAGIYEQYKITDKESAVFFELLGLLQDGRYNPKRITIHSNTVPKKLSFESKEIINYFLSGIHSQFKRFMGGTDFQRIKSEVTKENRQNYKQRKDNDKGAFVKLFLKHLLRYIKSDPIFSKDTAPTPNKQMRFIIDLLEPSAFTNYATMDVRRMRELLTT